ncbi:uncharacterized protein V6R79_022446 [Siganus canaliculatus]
MSEDQNNFRRDFDATFIKSKRGNLKVAEMVTLFVAFVSFTKVLVVKYTAAAALEFLITLFLVLLYVFKLNKTLTFFFWPLIDVFNSVFGAVYFTVLSLMAMITYTFTSMLVGGIFSFLCAVLLCVDCYMLFKNITFNSPRSEAQGQDNNNQ